MLRDILNYTGSRILVSLVCILISCIGARAQTEIRPEACVELGDPKDFVAVDENRGRLQRELPELRAKAKDLIENKIPPYEKAEKDLKDTEAKIESLQKLSPNGNNPQLANLEKLKASLENLLAGKSVEALNKELVETNDQISWKEAQLKCVNADMRKLLITPEQSFKREMSLYFAIIIFSLISGFFVMGWRYKSVGRGNFSGQTGLQFVTLFSIVIAIILFGITGILEAKELAALLGGLSGYILGRSSSPQGGQASANTGQSSGGGGNVSITVSTIASVTIDPTTATLTEAAPTQQLTATATDAQKNPVSGLPNYIFQWISDNPSVAIVDQTGLVTRVSAGSCKVTAIANGVSSNPCVVSCE